MSEPNAAQSLIADIPTPAMPVWSPDGSSIAYLWDAGAGWELWVTGTDGTGARRVATDSVLARDRLVAGRRVGCLHPAHRWRQHYRGRRRFNRHSSAARWSAPSVATLVTGWQHDRVPVWQRWQAGRLGGAGWRGRADAATERTNPLDEPRWTPHWSPDGRWITSPRAPASATTTICGSSRPRRARPSAVHPDSSSTPTRSGHRTAGRSLSWATPRSSTGTVTTPMSGWCRSTMFARAS